MRQSHLVAQVLIQWDFLDNAIATWEDVLEIQQSFLEFNLEDKVACNGGSFVTCKSNDNNIDVELDVESKTVTKDPCGQRLRKSMRRRRDNVFLRDYVL